MRNLCRYAHFLPFVIGVVFVCTLIITYSVAVNEDHIYPYWPYISDTGALSPESCIFSLLLDVVSLLVFLVIYLRYRQVSEFSKENPGLKIPRWCNKTATVIGYLACVGLSLVANFQETTAFAVHIVGAISCFSLTTIYFALQSWFTLKMKFVGRIFFWFRLLFTLLSALFFATVFAPLKHALTQFKGKDFLKWTEKDGGYSSHLISTISEWLLVLVFQLYIITFYWEFRKMELSNLNVKFAETKDAETDPQVKSGERISQWV